FVQKINKSHRSFNPNKRSITIVPMPVLTVESSLLPPSPSPPQQHVKNTFPPFNANALTPAQQDSQNTSVACLNPEFQSPFNALTSSQASCPFSENSYCNLPLFNPFTSSQTLSTFSGNPHYCNPPSISPCMFDPSFGAANDTIQNTSYYPMMSSEHMFDMSTNNNAHYNPTMTIDNNGSANYDYRQ
ncbi:13641_t:CDS:2, partial [Racocetra persica]